MKSEEVKEFGLVIIESLRENDKKTGTILHEETIKYKKFVENNLSSYLFVVKDKEEFFEVLMEIISKIKSDNFFPILHLEMHGFEDGLQLSNGDIVNWSILMPILCEINELLTNMLVIMLGLCKGASIISYIDPSNRAPFRAIIGATRDIDEYKLLIGCQAFYDNFFFSFDPVKSLDLMNHDIDEQRPTFHLLTSEQCFDAIVDPDRDPVSYNKMVDNHAFFEQQTNVDFKDIPFEQIRVYMEKKIRDMLLELRENKDYFLMNDLRKTL